MLRVLGKVFPKKIKKLPVPDFQAKKKMLWSVTGAKGAGGAKND
jgi:hypothetical protein